MADELEELAKRTVECVLAVLTPEDRLKGLSPRERVQGLSPDELLALSPEQKRAVLQRLRAEEVPA